MALIDQANNYLSSERVKFEAYDNILKHMEINVGNYRENITASLANIKDLDVAKEIAELSKMQTLLQSSQAMLTQSQQINQGILNILK